MPSDPFITYSHPNERLQTSNRRRVAKFIAVHHRNRSAPSTKSAFIPRKRSDVKLLLPRGNDHADGKALASVMRLSGIPRDGSGLLDDPFSALPTSDLAGVVPALKYYIEVYAPSHLMQSGAITAGDKQWLIQKQVNDAVQLPFMFEAILALAFSNLAVFSPTAHDIERSALIHYGCAISLLRTNIARGGTGDAVLMSIVSIIGTNYLQNNLSAFQVNLAGLRQVITLRGGLDSFSHAPGLQAAILTIESFWTYLRAQKHLLAPGSLPAITYESPPITENEEESLLERMPPGFKPLFDQHHLSSRIARIIVQEAKQLSTLHFSPPASFLHGQSMRKFADLTTEDREMVTVGSHFQTCEELARVLVLPDLTHLDYICCIGMFINALCIAKSEQLSPIYHHQVQHHARQLLACDLMTEDCTHRDLHAWVIFQVASTMVPTRARDHVNTHNDVRLHLAVKVVEAYLDHTWAEMEDILRGFICSEVCIKVFENVWDLGRQQIGITD